MKIALVSLGCSRTLVDSEVALGSLVREGYTIVRDVEAADVAIVNTCGFIEAAKTESIETILELCALKKKGKLSGVVVLGCLAQRYGKEIADQIQEADAVIGTNNYGDLAKVLEPLRKQWGAVGAGLVLAHKGRPQGAPLQRIDPKPHYLLDENTLRYSLTPDYMAYVKISEGCINACTYCVIPKMKGPHRSRTIDSILKEIEKLSAEKDLSEINLVGQDTAAFGYDLDKTFQLPKLLRAIARESRVPWIRLLYAHPGHVSEEMIDALAEEPRLCKYVDFPIEHSHDAMLLRMNRQVTREKMEWGIRTLRQRMPGVSLRTTVIVGFPGETEEEFRDLLDFLKEVRFDRLGAFQFSQEEGSRAFGLPGQIPAEVRQERYNAVMALQRDISEEMNQEWVGRDIQVLVEEKTKNEKDLYSGRTERDAPEVDGQVILHAARVGATGPATEASAGRRAPLLVPGQFVQARVTDALEYDLVASTAMAS